jgi:uncharacterized protein with HEPN domain
MKRNSYRLFLEDILEAINKIERYIKLSCYKWIFETLTNSKKENTGDSYVHCNSSNN